MNENRLIACAILILTAPQVRAETLPAADAEVFFAFIDEGRAKAQIVIPDSPAPVETLAAEKLASWARDFMGADLPIRKASEATYDAGTPSIILGTAEDQPVIAELIKTGRGRIADLPFLGEEGFALETSTRGTGKLFVIAGRNPQGVFHGAIYSRDFLLDITKPDQQAVIRSVGLVRSPALQIRGPYLLPQYGACPQYTLDHWKHIIDMMAEGGINQIHWWVAGLFPSKRYPETYEITTTKMSVEDVRDLCRFAQARGMKFLVGGGGFFWHGIQKIGETHPELKAVETGGLCPSQPKSQRIMAEYALEWLETFPESDGLWIEPRDEGGLCKCPLCSPVLDQYNSRQYGQSEIRFLKDLMRQVWSRKADAKLVWLIEHLEQKTFLPHYEDVLYFEAIREIKDPRIEWMVVWEQFKLPGPRAERLPVPFFTRHAQHWDKPYWPNLHHVFAHARLAAEQGYLGYSNAWEIGFASNDWYKDEVPYPVDLIPEIVTSLGFREACWEPGQTFEQFGDRVHRRFFSREAPRSLADDVLYLRQYITSANHEFRSPMDYNEKKPLLSEVDRVAALKDKEREQALTVLAANVETLRMTRDEALPRMARIEASLQQLDPDASRKSSSTFALIRRAIADSRKVYDRAVPSADVLDRAVAQVSRMKALASAPADAKP